MVYIEMDPNPEKLKSLREKVNWEIEKERCEFLNQFVNFIEFWKQDALPNLEDIFRREEIDWILSAALKKCNSVDFDDSYDGKRIIDFVARTGYIDINPEVDEDGKPLPRRTTLLHQAARDYYISVEIIPSLFKIYNNFEVNYTDEFGLTHFHIACQHLYGCYDFVEKFLELGQVDPNLLVPETGDTPLHLALKYRNKATFELLLRRGANPESTNEAGWTPLHVISRYCDSEFMQIFFKINAEELDRQLRIDARDKRGRTPLQVAVARADPNKVDVLLDRGADLSGFVFPDESHFEERVDSPEDENVKMRSILRLVSGVLACVESLEKRGYELDRSDALTIATLLDVYGFFKKSSLLLASTVLVHLCNSNRCNKPFERSTDLEFDWYDDEWFTRQAKTMMMNSSRSLYDLTRLRLEETEKLLAYSDYFRLTQSCDWCLMPDHVGETCAMHLCGIMLRRFLLEWALEFFMELSHYRMSVECYRMIIEQLSNEDLCNVCFAAKG